KISLPLLLPPKRPQRRQGKLRHVLGQFLDFLRGETLARKNLIDRRPAVVIENDLSHDAAGAAAQVILADAGNDLANDRAENIADRAHGFTGAFVQRVRWLDHLARHELSVPAWPAFIEDPPEE